ncbi:MAG: hypothetical protein HXM47_01325 [Pseudoleptotrichia goodfellowii]|nr:hypothetical protein [Pseudoleptotrichia goodfellowii]
MEIKGIIGTIKGNKMKITVMFIFTMIFVSCYAIKNPNPKNTSTTAVEKEDIVNVDMEKVIEEINSEIRKTDKDKNLKKKVKVIKGSGKDSKSEYTGYRSKNSELRKVTVKHFAETGRLIQEFYVKNGKIYYLYQKKMTYNRPIGWTKAKAKESGDTEYFNLEKSEVEEAKYYFDFDENLVRFISEDGSINDNQEILKVIKNDLKDEYLMNIQNIK